MLRTTYGWFKETASAWVDDKASSRGAALAYYSMFAIAPIVVLAVSLAGLVYGGGIMVSALAAWLSVFRPCFTAPVWNHPGAAGRSGAGARQAYRNTGFAGDGAGRCAKLLPLT